MKKHRITNEMIHPELRYEQIWIPREDCRPEEPKLRLCVYRPQEPTENTPAILWMHGGGYGLGLAAAPAAPKRPPFGTSDLSAIFAIFY